MDKTTPYCKKYVCPSRISLTSVCVDPNLLDVLRSLQQNALNDGGEKSVSSPASRQASVTEIQIVVDR